MLIAKGGSGLPFRTGDCLFLGHIHLFEASQEHTDILLYSRLPTLALHLWLFLWSQQGVEIGSQHLMHWQGILLKGCSQ